MLIWFEVVVIILLILTNGLLAMSEMALVSSKKARLKKLADDQVHGANAALHLHESTGDFLASIQVGITLIGVLAGAFSGATLSEKISAALTTFHPPIERYADGIGLGVVVLFVTYFSLVLGELVPKKLALNNPEKIASRVALIISLLGKVLRPIVYFLSSSTSTVLKLLGAAQPSDKTITEEEVKILIEEGTEAGVFDKEEETMMKRVLRLDDNTVEDLMTPRTRVVGIDLNDSLDNILFKISQYSHSYFPVFNKTMDNAVGILSVKTLLARFIKNEPIIITECLAPAYFLPKNLPADAALQKFRETGKHIAFAIDEYGGFSGIISVFDITESIVGEIPNNNQSINKKIVKRHDGSLLVNGQMSMQDLAEYLKVKLEDDSDFQTVGGLVMHKLGHIPSEGEFIKISGYRIEVIDMDGKRIDKVLITKSKKGVKLTAKSHK